MAKSTDKVVVLDRVDLQTSGVYTCEILTEANYSFATLSKQGEMVVGFKVNDETVENWTVTE